MSEHITKVEGKSLRADGVLIENVGKITLPEFEKISDTDSSGGILGEIDVPSEGRFSSSSITITMNGTDENYGTLASAKQLEIRWVTGTLNNDSSGIETGVKTNKVIASVMNKKYGGEEVEEGEKEESELEFEVISYYKYCNGKELVALDKLGKVYRLNGKDMLSNITSFL